MSDAGHFSLPAMALSLFVGLMILADSSPATGEPVDLSTRTNVFAGLNAGDVRDVKGFKLCWCPPGTFKMGSPLSENERRPGEDQVEVVLTRGFWMGKYEV